MTYDEAVKRMADLVPGFGKGQEYRDALAVLRRAEKVMEKVEKAQLPVPNHESFGAYFQWATDEDVILGVASDYREEKP